MCKKNNSIFLNEKLEIFIHEKIREILKNLSFYDFLETIIIKLMRVSLKLCMRLKAIGSSFEHILRCRKIIYMTLQTYCIMAKIMDTMSQ